MMRIVDLAFHNIDNQLKEKLEKSRDWSGSLVVREYAPAIEIADIVDLNKLGLVVVIDKNDVVMGALLPETVIKRATDELKIDFSRGNFSTVVAEIQKRGTPGKFGHEWLNTWQPDWYWCDRGHHLTSKKNCPLKH